MNLTIVKNVIKNNKVTNFVAESILDVMEKKLVSVIIPAYNAADYVADMVSMLKAQTYKDIEILIVDDGSQDDTLDKCRSLTQEDDRFRIFTKPNGGASSARNYGMKKSRGDFIAFVDADDYIYPEYLERLYKLINEYQADWAQCSFIKSNEKKRPEQYEKLRTHSEKEIDENVIVFDRKSAMIDFAYRRHLTGSPWAKIIRREIAEQISFPEDLKYSEDYTYIYELVRRTDRIAFLDSVEYLYLQRRESVIHMKRSRASEYQKGWEQLKRIYQEVIETMPYARGGVLERCYMQAVKDVSRIYDRKTDAEYLNELYIFIKQNGKNVFCDRKNPAIRRLLGLAGWISPAVTCFVCGVMLRHGFVLRRT